MSEFGFEPWPKTARLNRDITITEKIDGTNAAVIVHEDGAVGAQSRKRLIVPGDDNYGFAAWVAANAGALADTLGPGRHFGEWWGSGIQRRYGMSGGERYFSLFNTARWSSDVVRAVDGLDVVPVLYEGPFSELAIKDALRVLREDGSVAAPGYMDAEGIVIWHSAARLLFKVTLEGDEAPKSAQVAA